MIKKFLATAAVAASVAGISAAVAAPQAMALGNDNGTTTVNGNGAEQSYGNTYTSGYMSPSFALVQGSLNKPCVGLPLKANAGSLIGAIPVSVQDLNVLTSPQNQQCVENSTQSQGDEPLSHILDNIPVLTGNGQANG
ncbi:rodlin [Streptomyces sp. NRRL F-5123]|uniref:rodlin n=1 Tax=Streptomyces sp. NRRL F-5123 TaxID=1463856 RepID=UPI0004E16A5E|nr:rodlin [Streptomyces sp. NRRL F-5123]